jgi:uncharacterized repeat protein (TIGR03803 family)
MDDASSWTETVLHRFDGARGANPAGGLIADAAGNLYGTASDGGNNACFVGCGLVFELSPPAAGKKVWTETVLHFFRGTDGQYSVANLIADAAGNLYGTTEAGGVSNDGVVFELSPPAAGQVRWAGKVLHSFNGTRGDQSRGALLTDGSGNFYGMTLDGGKSNDGVVFKLTPR